MSADAGDRRISSAGGNTRGRVGAVINQFMRFTRVGARLGEVAHLNCVDLYQHQSDASDSLRLHASRIRSRKVPSSRNPRLPSVRRGYRKYQLQVKQLLRIIHDPCSLGPLCTSPLQQLDTFTSPARFGLMHRLPHMYSCTVQETEL